MQAKRYQSQREIRQWHAFSGCLWGRVPYVAFTVCSEARRSCTWGTRAAESHRFLQAAKMFFFWVYTWKDWCWSWNSNTLATWCEEPLEKTLMLGKIEGKRRGRQRMRWLDGITDLMHMSFSKLWDGQGSLECCSPWGWKKSDTTEQFNWTDSLFLVFQLYIWYLFNILIQSR